MQVINIVLTLVLGLGIEAAKAQGASVNQSTLKIEDAKETKNKVDGDIDQEIVNPKMRAESGSKSKFSGSNSMTYRGGALSKPFGAERPDLSGLPESQVESSLDLGMKIRYRSSMSTSFTLGVSSGLRTPFQGDVDQDESRSQLNVGDPILGYNYTFANWGLQNSMNLYATAGTSKESIRVDQAASLGADFTMMKNLNNGFQVGFTGGAYTNFFENKPGSNRQTVVRNRIDVVDRRSAWGISLMPVVEYYFSDKVSFRTLFGTFRWRHLYGHQETFSLARIKEYQSVGLGLSITRDVYLYPNVQFLPLDIRSDYTNVGITTTVNMF